MALLLVDVSCRQAAIERAPETAGSGGQSAGTGAPQVEPASAAGEPAMVGRQAATIQAQPEGGASTVGDRVAVGVPAVDAREPAQPSGVKSTRARVRAAKPIGVPVHPEEGARSVSGRLADGQLVEVLEQGASGWYLVRATSLQGWITPRYLELSAAGSEPGRSDASEARKVSGSTEQCRRELSREPAQQRQAPRVASWNVRWFPDGGAATEETDIEWLACEMARLQAPIIAVQEFTTTASERGPLRRLLIELDRLTGGRWQAEFDRCPGRRFQHVGLLYDAARVHGSHFVQLDQLNPKHGCTGRLRPGLSGYFRFPDGPDLHVVSVHLKAQSQRSARQLRRRSLKRLPDAVAQLRQLVDDEDVLLAGDLNSVGSRPDISAEQELREMDAMLSNQSPAFRRVPSVCSYYHRGAPTAVDHFLITDRSTELPKARAALTKGYCGALACQASKQLPAAYRSLSDHCPIVVALEPQDDD